jgi:hypothetical protein
MTGNWKQGATASCQCGQVELVATGKPIITAACYCDDCHAAARTLEALPGAPPVLERDGGTSYVMYRNDRIRLTKGRERLKPFKLKETAHTRRQVASCCNTPMYMDFDSGPHWVDLYRARVQGDAPPIEIRTCTKFAPAGTTFNDGIPSPAMHTGSFYWKLLAAWIPMLINPKPKGP